MLTELTQAKIVFPTLTSGRVDRGGDSDWDGDESGGPRDGGPLISSQLGVWVFLGVVTMLFACLASAYVVRRAGTDWQHIDLPSILWFNTGVLLVSSVTMEAARSARKGFRQCALRCWLGGTLALGLVFLGGQILAWQQLAARGIYLPTNPHSSFVYILTGLHGLHLAGGILWLGYALAGAWRRRTNERQATSLQGVATYWHFLAALWVGVLGLLALL